MNIEDLDNMSDEDIEALYSTVFGLPDEEDIDDIDDATDAVEGLGDAVDDTAESVGDLADNIADAGKSMAISNQELIKAIKYLESLSSMAEKLNTSISNSNANMQSISERTLAIEQQRVEQEGKLLKLKDAQAKSAEERRLAREQERQADKKAAEERRQKAEQERQADKQAAEERRQAKENERKEKEKERQADRLAREERRQKADQEHQEDRRIREETRQTREKERQEDRLAREERRKAKELERQNDKQATEERRLAREKERQDDKIKREERRQQADARREAKDAQAEERRLAADARREARDAQAEERRLAADARRDARDKASEERRLAADARREARDKATEERRLAADARREAREAQAKAREEINKLNKIKTEQMNTANRSKGAVIDTFVNIPNGSDKLLKSSLNNLEKIAPDIFKSFMGTKAGQALASNTTFKAGSAEFIKLTSALGKALPLVAGITLALTAMTAAGAKASKTTLEITQSLTKFGGSLGEISNNAVESSNKLTSAKNGFKQLGDALSSLFTPLYNGFSDLAYSISELIDISRDFGTATTDLSNRLLNAAKQFSNEGLKTPINESLATMTNTSSRAQQAGFSLSSSANLGIGTYNAATNLAIKYGQGDQVDSIAQKLTDAWTKGSDAAKEYGIVVNDETLYGWLAQEKGVDAVNVKLSDAAIQAYRYELAMYEANQSGSDGLQDQIKGWKQYGMQLKNTQNQLLSFEKVITLKGIDPNIPEIKEPEIKINDIEKSVDEFEDNFKPVIAPTIKPPDPKDTTVAVKAETAEAEQAVKNLGGLLGSVPDNVLVTAEVPAINGLNELTLLSTEANYLLNNGQIKTNADISVSGLEKLSTADTLLQRITVFLTKLGQVDFGKITLDAVVNSTALGHLGEINQWLIDSGLSAKAQKANDWINEHNVYKNIGKLSLGALTTVGGAAIASSGIVGKIGSEIVDKIPFTIDFSTFKNGIGIPGLLMGHAANGGISTKAHLTAISENDTTEAIIPLDNSSATSAYEKIAEGIVNKMGIQMPAGNQTSNTYNLAPGGVVIADNYAMDKFVEMIANKLATLYSDRGDLGYGTR